MCKIEVSHNEASSLFSTDRSRKSGFANKCKACKRKYDKKREVQKNLKGRRNLSGKDKLRSKAKYIFKGKYDKCSALNCDKKAELHHLHYRDNSSVVPLCRLHHVEAHYSTSDLEQELQSLKDQLAQSKKDLEKAERVIEFYADPVKTWEFDSFIKNDLSLIGYCEDGENWAVNNPANQFPYEDFVGGKKARQYFKEKQDQLRGEKNEH